MNFFMMLNVRQIILFLQHAISFAGILIIVSGVAIAVAQYLKLTFKGELISNGAKLNHVRLDLVRIFLLGLEFIVASDLIGTTTTPDYYALGLVAIIVLIRTLLSFSLTRELTTLSKK